MLLGSHVFGHQNDTPASHACDIVTGELFEVTTPTLVDRWLIGISVFLPLPCGGAALLTFTSLLQQVGD
jgi:hypothetical protein